MGGGGGQQLQSFRCICNSAKLVFQSYVQSTLSNHAGTNLIKKINKPDLWGLSELCFYFPENLTFRNYARLAYYRRTVLIFMCCTHGTESQLY
jgi:hypothetical protein